MQNCLLGEWRAKRACHGWSSCEIGIRRKKKGAEWEVFVWGREDVWEVRGWKVEKIEMVVRVGRVQGKRKRWFEMVGRIGETG